MLSNVWNKAVVVVDNWSANYFPLDFAWFGGLLRGLHLHFIILNCFSCWLNICLSLRYKFDDERVTKEDTKRALEEQYGGEEEVTGLLPLVVVFDPFKHLNLLVNASTTCFFFFFGSYLRQILDSTTLLSNSPNIRMHTCLFIYVNQTRTK